MPIFYTDTGSISDLVVSNKLEATGSLFGTASYVSFVSSADSIGVNVSAGTLSNKVSQVVLSNANSVSFGLNASTVTATAQLDGGDAFTYPYYNPKDAYVQVLGTWGNGSLFMQPMQVDNVQFDRVAVPMFVSATTQNNSTMGLSLSLSWGLYTRNGSTLSLLSDYTAQTTFQTATIGTSNTSIYNGIRLWTLGLTKTLTEGQYYVGMISSVTNTRGTVSNVVASQLNSSFFGLFGQAYNLSIQYTRGLGLYSTSTNALPSGVAISELYGAATYTTAAGSATNVLRPPLFYLVSQTF
jgi:hypothetical protein